jgi:outer membrane lipoprotein SlyB
MVRLRLEGIPKRRRAMKRSLAAFTAVLWFVGGCSTTGNWRPTVDTFGSSNAQFVSRDTEECRQLALQASGNAPAQGAQGMLLGGLVGAAGGAALGAALGNPGRGAAIGAAAGGIGGGVRNASNAEQTFQRAFSSCMAQRGHRVIN